MEILPEDIIVSSYSKGTSSWVYTIPKCISLYHKPTGITVTSEGGSTAHRSVHLAMEKLRQRVIRFEEDKCWEEYNVQ